MNGNCSTSSRLHQNKTPLSILDKGVSIRWQRVRDSLYSFFKVMNILYKAFLVRVNP